MTVVFLVLGHELSFSVGPCSDETIKFVLPLLVLDDQVLVICLRGSLIPMRPPCAFSTDFRMILCHLKLSILNLCHPPEDLVERRFAKAIYTIYLRVKDEVFGPAGVVASAAVDHMVEWAGQGFVRFARGFGAAADVQVRFALWVSALYNLMVMRWLRLTFSGSYRGE